MEDRRERLIREWRAAEALKDQLEDRHVARRKTTSQVRVDATRRRVERAHFHYDAFAGRDGRKIEIVHLPD